MSTYLMSVPYGLKVSNIFWLYLMKTVLFDFRLLKKKNVGSIFWPHLMMAVLYISGLAPLFFSLYLMMTVLYFRSLRRGQQHMFVASDGFAMI